MDNGFVLFSFSFIFLFFYFILVFIFTFLYFGLRQRVKSGLSLIPPSCMVVPNRKIVNSNISTYTSAISHLAVSNVNSEDIQMGAPRGRSNVASTNSLREFLVLSKVSSIKYAAHIEA